MTTKNIISDLTRHIWQTKLRTATRMNKWAFNSDLKIIQEWNNFPPLNYTSNSWNKNTASEAKLKKASYDERKTTRVYKIREPTLKTTSSLIITENSKFISATEIKAAGDSLWSCSDGGGDGAGAEAAAGAGAGVDCWHNGILFFFRVETFCGSGLFRSSSSGPTSSWTLVAKPRSLLLQSRPFREHHPSLFLRFLDSKNKT